MTKKYSKVQPSKRVHAKKLFKPADMRNPRRIKRKLEIREEFKVLNEMVNMSMDDNQQPYPIDEDQHWETNVLAKAVQQILYLEKCLEKRQERSQQWMNMDESTISSDVDLVIEEARERAKLNKVRKINQ